MLFILEWALYKNRLISDYILDLVLEELKSVNYKKCVDFRLTPEQFVLKVNEKAEHIEDYKQFKIMLFEELERYKTNPLRYQTYLWAFIEALNDSEEAHDSTFMTELCQLITLKDQPFYAKAQLFIANEERANSKIENDEQILDVQKVYLKKLLHLSSLGLTETTLMEGTIKSILFGNHGTSQDIPEEMKNPQLTGNYILSLIELNKKLMKENEELKSKK